MDRMGERGCYYGSLANYIFNRVWLVDYTSPLSVERDPTRTGELWRLMNVGSQYQYGRGTKDEMEALRESTEAVIARQDRAQFTKKAVALFEKLRKLQGQIARIQVNGTLEGSCPATG
jgi:hypothetical protein